MVSVHCLLSGKSDLLQEVVNLRYFFEISIPEIAELLGERPNTVQQRLTRALERLRDESRQRAGRLSVRGNRSDREGG